MKNMITSAERLYVRKVNEDDFGYIYKLSGESLKEDWRKDEKFVEINSKCLWDELTQSDVCTGLVFLKETDEFIGQINIRNLDKQIPEIGIRLLEEHWNKGYAYEALKSFCNWFYCAYGICKIRVRIKNNNRASIRLFEKLGASFQSSVQYISDDFDKEILKLFTEEEINSLNKSKSIREYILNLPLE